VLKAANTAEYKLNEVSKGGKEEDEPLAATPEQPETSL
jgi:hypothetical protein